MKNEYGLAVEEIKNSPDEDAETYSTTLDAPMCNGDLVSQSRNSVAFVTGAASGIGLAVAQRLIADGIKQIALIDLNSDLLAEVFKDLDESVTSLQITCDVSQEDQVENAVAKTVEKFGRIDFCLNAAGIAPRLAGIAEQETKDLERTLGVNLFGVWYCERAQIRQMLKQDTRDLTTGLPFKTRGSIVNVGSICSFLAQAPGGSSYTISKHGVLGLTRTDAHDYAAQGIRVNCLCPGWVMSGIHTFNEHSKPFYDSRIARVPMGRFGEPEEIAYFASFVLSDKASFMTGASLNIDGGLTAH